MIQSTRRTTLRILKRYLALSSSFLWHLCCVSESLSWMRMSEVLIRILGLWKVAMLGRRPGHVTISTRFENTVSESAIFTRIHAKNNLLRARTRLRIACLCLLAFGAMFLEQQRLRRTYEFAFTQLSLARSPSNHFVTCGYFSKILEYPTSLAMLPYGRWKRSATVTSSPARYFRFERIPS